MNLGESIRQLGLVLTLQNLVARATLRIFGLEICLIALDAGRDHDPIEGYDMEMVDGPRFRVLAGDEVFANHSASFAKGDQCVVTLFDGAVVGYNFYSNGSTPVNDYITFDVPPDHLYSYGAYTHPEHRGKRLSPARWTFAKRWREAHDVDAELAFYIALNNYASLRSGHAGKPSRNIVGYAAWRLSGHGKGQRARCYRSPACRRAGIGFSPLEAP